MFSKHAFILKPKAFWRGPWEEAAAMAVVDAVDETGALFDSRRTDPSLADADTVLFCIGGDGSVLQGLRAASATGAAVAGINMGKLGFLAPFDSSRPDEAAETVFSGAAETVERTLASVTLPDGRRILAANEIAISRMRFGKPSRFSFCVAGRRAGDFAADGLLVATATGSTGHSLSAGGPPVDPSSRSAVISMVSPMSLSARSIVVPWRLGITCSASVPEGEPVVVTADGIVVSESESDRPFGLVFDSDPPTVRSLVPPGWSFYDAAREKLGWGFQAGY